MEPGDASESMSRLAISVNISSKGTPVPHDGGVEQDDLSIPTSLSWP